jgi:hypothetical protein
VRQPIGVLAGLLRLVVRGVDRIQVAARDVVPVVRGELMTPSGDFDIADDDPEDDELDDSDTND